MSEMRDQADGASHPRSKADSRSSGQIRRPALRARRKYVSKSDMVTDELRELITDRQLSPGTPLRQRDLAEQFDVSYTPVREALRRLESEGLVVTDVHRGATVARTESEEMEENYRILAVLETLAGTLAVSKMTDPDLTEIETLYRQVAACHPDDSRPPGQIRQPAPRARRKYVSKSDMVTDELRELITDRQLSPGTPLRQRDLAEQFDVSYTPVREALRRLESEGLVATDVHRGATVARTESEEIEENYRILAVLEALAGTLAVSKMTDPDLTEIETLYCQVAACHPDDSRLAELNRQFHFRIYECARSPMLLLLH